MYIDETKRRLGTRIKEHKDARVKYHVEKSAIAKHARTTTQQNWAETMILQRANRAMELVLKESLSIRTTPEFFYAVDQFPVTSRSYGQTDKSLLS